MPSDPDAVGLKLCPFCGSLAWMHSARSIFSGAPGWRVECEGVCHAMTCWWHTEAEAIAAWNRRAPMGGVGLDREGIAERIDQIAAAMFKSTSIANGGATHGIWADYGEAGREFFRDMARIALSALPEAGPAEEGSSLVDIAAVPQVACPADTQPSRRAAPVCPVCEEPRGMEGYCRCDEDWFFDMDGKP